MTATQQEFGPRRIQRLLRSPLCLQLALSGILAVLSPGLSATAGLHAESRNLIGLRSALPLAPLPVSASNVSIENYGDRAKLSFDVTQSLAATSFVLAGPDRVVVDMPETNFRIDPQVGEKLGREPRAGLNGLIASYRFGLFAPGKSRVVIDLAGPARVIRAGMDAGATKPRFVIELARTDDAAFRVAAAAAVEAADTAANAADQATRVKDAAQTNANQPLIVIDPGHGGIDSGAMVNGLVEKNIVFDFAKMLEAKLVASGHYKVVMTRDRDVFLSLGERVHIAEDSGAALFVSIHADTINDAANVSGATVYTLADHASDAEAERTAEKENQADAVAGVTGHDEASGVSDILADLTRQETRAYSHVFARTLVNYWKVAARLNKNPERAAGFRVLKAPGVPSVLVELGYLSNAKDAASLLSPEWREATSGRLAAAIDAFFAVRGTNFSAQPPAQLAPSEATTALEAPPPGEAK